MCPLLMVDISDIALLSLFCFCMFVSINKCFNIYLTFKSTILLLSFCFFNNNFRVYVYCYMITLHNLCCRCGNVAAILELDEHLQRDFTIFEAAPQVLCCIAVNSFCVLCSQFIMPHLDLLKNVIQSLLHLSLIID